MNMISTGAFLTEMDASNKQPTVAEKFAAVWEKKNAKAARAGGVSLMALSLAACGGSSSTTTTNTDTTTTPEPTTPVAPVAKSLSTTVQRDTLEGGAGDDTFTVADDVQLNGTTGQYVNNITLGTGDTLTGGDGADTLNISRVGNLADPSGETVTGIETVTVDATGTATINTSSWTGTTSLTVDGTGGLNVDAATTTTVVATDDNLATGTAAADGGSDVTLTVSKVTSGTVDVGATTKAAGNVVVNVNMEKIANTGNVDHTDGGGNEVIEVTGGDTITVNVDSGASATTKAATNYTITNPDVDIDGDTQTTAVTVNFDAMVAVAAGTTATGKVGVTGGAVTIDDGNANTTGTDTLTTVTLGNTGAATVTSTVLSTLNVTGASSATLGGNMDITLNISGAGKETQTKALTIKGSGHIGDIAGTHADDQTSLTIEATDALTIAKIDAMTALTSITASGAGVTTITDQDLATAITSYTSTGGGLVISNAIPTGASFTGGAGADGVYLGATTKAISMGAGDDKVTLSADLGTGGTVAGGDGTDTLVLDVVASTFNNPSAQPRITGFETLELGALSNGTTYNAAGFTALSVADSAADVGFTNVAAGVGLTLKKTTADNVDVVLADATGKADSIDVTMVSKAAIDYSTSADITLAGIETVNFIMSDSDTTAHVNVATLVATSAKTVTVTGDTGLNLTNTGNTAITSFDASGVTLGKVTDTGVTFVSANTTAGENVTIKGGNGVDSLTGHSATHDTINGGAGVDTLVYTGGSDTFTGGDGKDVFDVNADGTATVYLTIADLTTGDTIDLAGVADGTNAIADGKIGAATTYGAGATFAQALNAAAAGTGGATTSTADWFQFDGNTYLVVDNSNNATWTAGTDSVIAITGLVDLKDATFATEVLTIA